MPLKAPKGMTHAFHEDDERIDEISIVTIPRYKTSGLSGDEWRVSVQIRLLYKRQLVARTTVNNFQTAAMFLGHFMVTSSESDQDRWRLTSQMHDLTCDQPGCFRIPISQYMMKARYDAAGHKDELPQVASKNGFKKPYYRQFCRRHLCRGNCGLDDADSNYTVIIGPGPDKAKFDVGDESPAIFGGVIDLTGTRMDADAITSHCDQHTEFVEECVGCRLIAAVDWADTQEDSDA